jgi:hypothetical protein
VARFLITRQSLDFLLFPSPVRERCLRTKDMMQTPFTAASLIKRHAHVTEARQIAPVPKITFSDAFPQKLVSILGPVR